MGVYNEALAAIGKPAPKELPLFREVYCAPTRAQAIEMAAPYLVSKYKDYGCY